MLLTVTILMFSLGTIWTNPVDVEHNPWGGNTHCGNYFHITDIVENCRGTIFDTDLFDGYATITVDALRAEVGQPCSPSVLEPYIACVRRVTAQCTSAEKEAILNETEAFYGRCDGLNTVASWIPQYALHNFSHVEPACIDYSEMCVDAVSRLHTPESTTPITEALQMARRNMAILFDCAREHSENVLSNLPGCAATGLDVFAAILIELTSNARLGIRMYPEQIRKLKELRGL